MLEKRRARNFNSTIELINIPESIPSIWQNMAKQICNILKIVKEKLRELLLIFLAAIYDQNYIQFFLTFNLFSQKYDEFYFYKIFSSLAKRERNIKCIIGCWVTLLSGEESELKKGNKKVNKVI